jgi:hypothetical protein
MSRGFYFPPADHSSSPMRRAYWHLRRPELGNVRKVSTFLFLMLYVLFADLSVESIRDACVAVVKRLEICFLTDEGEEVARFLRSSVLEIAKELAPIAAIRAERVQALQASPLVGDN